MQKLQDVCPQLASEFGGDANYCCTEEQIDTLTHQVGHFHPVTTGDAASVSSKTKSVVQIQQASTLLVGCPACDHNFKHFFCTLTCHPDQSTFVNVTDVQLTADTNVTAVKQVSRLCHQPC